jgi:hypothetical protein
VVFTLAENPMTFDEVENHREQLQRDSRFDPDFGQILSFLDVREVKLSAAEVRRLALDPVFSPRSRRAFVIHVNELFGLGRMFATHRDLRGESNIAVVRSMEEAATWVGIDVRFVEEAFAALKTGRTSP